VDQAIFCWYHPLIVAISTRDKEIKKKERKNSAQGQKEKKKN
jgi:hypothetical protein